MIEKYTQNKTFKQLDFSEIQISGYEFDDCQFINCNFSDCDMSSTDFMDCKFDSCNFMMAKTLNTGFKEVSFKGCKLVGIDFSYCNNFLFQVDFDSCQLDYAIFTKKNMKKTRFVNCSVKEADFSRTNLMEAVFEDTDLSDSLFSNSNLEKSDFRTASNFTIDPENNRIKGAIFSAYALSGLLRKYAIKIE